VRVVVHLGPQTRDKVLASGLDVETVVVAPDEPVDPALRADVLLTYPWGSPNLAELVSVSRVPWIHTIGTGVDRFPLDLVGDRLLTCSRGASAIPIAEWVLAQMLAFEKRLPASWITAPPAHWNIADLGGLHRRTLGLLGLGGIGAAVAERALPFGMRVLAARRSAQSSPLASVELAPFERVLAEADHLVLALPATPATRGIVGADALGRVKPGVHLVNVARGSLLDQEALRPALDDGRVALASLDTVEPEPLPEGHWLYGHPRVRLSPHVSWSFPHAFDLLIETFVENLRRRAAGEPLLGVVDLAAGY
jgi:phosphoglycerate dehydrogenase-like enzyme